MQKLAIRNPAKLEIESTLGDLYFQFGQACSRATSIQSFENAARKAGAEVHLAKHYDGLIDFGIEEGVFDGGRLDETIRQQFRAKATEKTIAEAALGIKTAASVVLHAGMEDYLHGMCRVGVACNRAKALELIANQQFVLKELEQNSADDVVDAAIELWLKKLRHGTVLDKWDRFVGFFGYPKTLASPPNWHFDRKMLETFDSVRHGAVHGAGKDMVTYDVVAFQTQCQRAVLCVVFHVCKLHGLQLNPFQIFCGPEWPTAFNAWNSRGSDSQSQAGGADPRH